MGYWESSLFYPDNKYEVWNSSAHCWTGSEGQDFNSDLNTYVNDLCGKPIRHHRFPDNAITPHFRKNSNGEYTIRLLGVRFKNIIFPKDNDGNDIPGIVGYEILTTKLKITKYRKVYSKKDEIKLQNRSR